MEHTFEACHKNLRARPLQHCDIEYLRAWRNDPEMTAFLSPAPHITREMQEQWFIRYLQDDDCYFLRWMRRRNSARLWVAWQSTTSEATQRSVDASFLATKTLAEKGLAVRASPCVWPSPFTRSGLKLSISPFLRTIGQPSSPTSESALNKPAGW